MRTRLSRLQLAALGSISGGDQTPRRDWRGCRGTGRQPASLRKWRSWQLRRATSTRRRLVWRSSGASGRDREHVGLLRSIPRHRDFVHCGLSLLLFPAVSDLALRCIPLLDLRVSSRRKAEKRLSSIWSDRLGTKRLIFYSWAHVKRPYHVLSASMCDRVSVPDSLLGTGMEHKLCYPSCWFTYTNTR